MIAITVLHIALLAVVVFIVYNLVAFAVFAVYYRRQNGEVAQGEMVASVFWLPLLIDKIIQLVVVGSLVWLLARWDNRPRRARRHKRQ